LSPGLNRRLRRSDADCVVRLVATPNGLLPEVVPLDTDVFTDEAAVLGPFHSAKDAWRVTEGKAREAALCLKMLGREPGPGSCFAYQLGKCRGACVGKEPRALHDARLQLAFASLRVRQWPFDGAIGIREPAPDSRGTRLHVIDRWQHLGTARDDAEVETLLQAQYRPVFDADSYRIINRCLRTLRSRDLVVFNRAGKR
jgi:DNA polymerase III subunit epsilon